MQDLFDFEPKPLLYAVFGNPIAHSKSPRVHGLFARQLGIQLEYRAVQVDIGGFDQAASGFQASGGHGLNVTVPFKLNACAYADELSSAARQAGAVNTLVLDDSVFGDNTDGIGLVTDITRNIGITIRSKRILIIGAGGATRGILGPLLNENPAALTVVNRTADKAAALAARFSDCGAVTSGGLNDALHQGYDIVIHATAAGLAHGLPEISAQVFAEAELAYDLMYADQPTAFQNWALRSGVRQSADGLGMLIEQAAESFALWHGQRPQTKKVIERIRKEL